MTFPQLAGKEVYRCFFLFLLHAFGQPPFPVPSRPLPEVARHSFSMARTGVTLFAVARPEVPLSPFHLEARPSPLSKIRFPYRFPSTSACRTLCQLVGFLPLANDRPNFPKIRLVSYFFRLLLIPATSLFSLQHGFSQSPPFLSSELFELLFAVFPSRRSCVDLTLVRPRRSLIPPPRNVSPALKAT